MRTLPCANLQCGCAVLCLDLSRYHSPKNFSQPKRSLLLSSIFPSPSLPILGDYSTDTRVCFCCHVSKSSRELLILLQRVLILEYQYYNRRVWVLLPRQQKRVCFCCHISKSRVCFCCHVSKSSRVCFCCHVSKSSRELLILLQLHQRLILLRAPVRCIHAHETPCAHPPR